MRLPATLHIKGQWREKYCSEVGWKVGLGLIFTNERVITYQHRNTHTHTRRMNPTGISVAAMGFLYQLYFNNS